MTHSVPSAAKGKHRLSCAKLPVTDFWKIKERAKKLCKFLCQNPGREEPAAQEDNIFGTGDPRGTHIWSGRSKRNTHLNAWKRRPKRTRAFPLGLRFPLCLRTEHVFPSWVACSSLFPESGLSSWVACSKVLFLLGRRCQPLLKRLLHVSLPGSFYTAGSYTPTNR